MNARRVARRAAFTVLALAVGFALGILVFGGFSWH